jgi:DNA-binding response OmpR family regulator
LKEFLIRVRHVLSRRQVSHSLRCGDLVIDLDAMSVDDSSGERVFLQVRDSRVLKLLIDAAPKAVDRSVILDQIWGEDQFPTPRAVDNAIVRLRQALKDDDGHLIRSVRGVGYQWSGVTK